MQLVLVFSTFLQLSTSFTAMAIGIWIDRIYRGAFRESAACAGLYRAIFFVFAVVSILALGSYRVSLPVHSLFVRHRR